LWIKVLYNFLNYLASLLFPYKFFNKSYYLANLDYYLAKVFPALLKKALNLLFKPLNYLTANTSPSLSSLIDAVNPTLISPNFLIAY